MAMIEIVNLTKRYNKFEAVKDLNLTIEEGDVFGFIGPNGAGKTTTIRILSTLLAPTSGQASINGVDVGEQVAVLAQELPVMGHAAPDARAASTRPAWSFAASAS